MPPPESGELFVADRIWIRYNLVWFNPTIMDSELAFRSLKSRIARRSIIMLRRVLFLSLFVNLTIVLTSIGVANEELDQAIRNTRGNIQELSTALERRPETEKANQWRASLKEYRARLQQLINRRFPEIHQAIQQTQEALQELRAQAEESQGEQLHEITQRMHKKENQLVKYQQMLEKRLAELNRKNQVKPEEQVRQLEVAIKELEHALEHHPESEKRESWLQDLKQNRKQLAEIRRQHNRDREKSKKSRQQLKIVHLKYGHAGNLAEIIESFLSEDGVVAADMDTDSVVVRDTEKGIETAVAIIKALDIPKASRHGDHHSDEHQDEHGSHGEHDEAMEKREDVFFGKLLEKRDRHITIETRDGRKEVNLSIPMREDGKLVDDFVEFIEQLEIGSM
ncbi:TPA: hypothetical protein EYN98_32255, partial [Candidatus Poribacteria bacterium]|nr:hypothetical protein [Candidatus Poribacteria bacterium]